MGHDSSGGETGARLAEILVLVIAELQRDPHILLDMDGLVEILVCRGVGHQEAHEAVAWLLTAMGEGSGGWAEEEHASGSPSGVHILGREDQAAVSLEAQGLLIELRELGLLDDIQVEEVIERALYRGAGAVGRGEIRSIVAEVLLDAATESKAGMACWLPWGGEEGAVH